MLSLSTSTKGTSLISRAYVEPCKTFWLILLQIIKSTPRYQKFELIGIVGHSRRKHAPKLQEFIIFNTKLYALFISVIKVQASRVIVQSNKRCTWIRANSLF